MPNFDPDCFGDPSSPRKEERKKSFVSIWHMDFIYRDGMDRMNDSLERHGITADLIINVETLRDDDLTLRDEDLIRVWYKEDFPRE